MRAGVYHGPIFDWDSPTLPQCFWCGLRHEAVTGAICPLCSVDGRGNVFTEHDRS